MKKMTFSALAALALSATVHANDITIIKKDSQDFALGKETHINMKIKAQDTKDMWMKLGVRIQGSFESLKTTKTGQDSVTNQDAYLRRTRFEAQAGFSKTTSFTMDIRNDKVNYQDKGEQTFNVGDAYVKIKKPFGSNAVNFKLYRAKIDVSRTETVKSARVIAYDRPKVADEAAQYITHNRRGTNAQAYGKLLDGKVKYQVAIGDATFSGKMVDAKGKKFTTTLGDVAAQSFFVGGKIMLSPFTGWEEKTRTETYMGKGKHFTVGASYWNVDNIEFDNNASLSRSLMNAEFSAHYKGAFIQAEYFEFDGVVADESAFFEGSETVKSKGYYVTGEYVFTSLNYMAPFFRYESWDKYDGQEGYGFESTLYGINWYLRGNTTKMGIVVQNDEYGVNIGDKKVESIRLTTQFFF